MHVNRPRLTHGPELVPFWNFPAYTVGTVGSGGAIPPELIVPPVYDSIDVVEDGSGIMGINLKLDQSGGGGTDYIRFRYAGMPVQIGDVIEVIVYGYATVNAGSTAVSPTILLQARDDPNNYLGGVGTLPFQSSYAETRSRFTVTQTGVTNLELLIGQSSSALGLIIDHTYYMKALSIRKVL